MTKKTLAWDYCDNTDCECSNIKQLLYRTMLIEDFDFDICYWCHSCRKQDEAMIEI